MALQSGEFEIKSVPPGAIRKHDFSVARKWCGPIKTSPFVRLSQTSNTFFLITLFVFLSFLFYFFVSFFSFYSFITVTSASLTRNWFQKTVLNWKLLLFKVRNDVTQNDFQPRFNLQKNITVQYVIDTKWSRLNCMKKKVQRFVFL